jgi:hypothetical protein
MQVLLHSLDKSIVCIDRPQRQSRPSKRIHEMNFVAATFRRHRDP